MITCIFCGKKATPGWETCNDCDIEQAQLAEAEKDFEEQYAREFAERTYAEQDELAYLDKMLFGGR